jgi:acyl-ACP thioesterase
MVPDPTLEREYVPEPSVGRRFSTDSLVRLSDALPSSYWRLDGVARALQDTATEDWEDCGIVTDALWLARRTSFRRVGPWPVIYDRLKLTTFCAGIGAAWAERRTNIYVGDRLVIEAASLWVPVDPRGFPVRLPATFHEIFGEAMKGRRVTGRVPVTAPPAGAIRRPWPLRRADLDVIGHVNNAAVWQAVAEVFDAPVESVDVIHHGPVEEGHEVELVTSGDTMWLVVDGQVRVTASVVGDAARDARR